MAYTAENLTHVLPINTIIVNNTLPQKYDTLSLHSLSDKMF